MKARIPTGTKTTEADALFAPVVKAFGRDRRVTLGSMFGSPGLRVGTRVFAMLVKGKLVVKLPKERVEGLVAAGEGERFDPGHGRVMKEWAAVGPASPSPWTKLAAEALDFVSKQAR